MLLIDANVFMEALRGRPQAGLVVELLESAPAGSLFTSVCALHSIGIALSRHGVAHAFGPFVIDTVASGRVIPLDLRPEQLATVPEVMSSLGLDFEDALQSVVATSHGLTIVSLDSDFDRTPHGRKTPAQAVEGLRRP